MFTGNEWKGILSPSIDGINVRQAEMVCVGHVAPIPLKRIHGSAGDHPRRKESYEKDLHLQGPDPPRPHYHGTVDLPNDYSVTAPRDPHAEGGRLPGLFSGAPANDDQYGSDTCHAIAVLYTAGEALSRARWLRRL